MRKGSTKHTIKQFLDTYPDDNACLDAIFKQVFKGCPKCRGDSAGFKRISTRQCYQCKCGYQFYPMAGTIFEKSSTPLTSWFHVMFMFSVSKNGISTMEVRRTLGVTYKTAWRMLRQIRKLIKEDTGLFGGTIELDETYIGGKNKNRHKNKKVAHSQGRSYKDKKPVFGMLARGGIVRAWPVPDTKAETLQPIVRKHIRPGSRIMTDEWMAYTGLSRDYEHQIVHHGKGQYVKDECYTNGLENFWSVVKRTLNGSYIQVSAKYLQLYINECVFRFNNRHNKDIFNVLLSGLCPLPA